MVTGIEVTGKSDRKHKSRKKWHEKTVTRIKVTEKTKSEKATGKNGNQNKTDKNQMQKKVTRKNGNRNKSDKESINIELVDK